MARQTSSGQCSSCGNSFGKGSMTRHIRACRQRSIAEGPQTKSFHLLVEGRYQPEYWIHLMAPENLTLESLDSFLRSIWLECCGHLSCFAIGNTRYSVYTEEDFDEVGMNVPLEKVLPSKNRFFYEYDYGSTTDLALRVVGTGSSAAGEISLLARNSPPPLACQTCHAPAVWVDGEAGWPEEGFVCAECAIKNDCDKDMLLPVVNSPRVGVCAYEG